MESTLVSLNDVFDENVINNEQYTISLLNEALNRGLVTDEFTTLFQMQLLKLFEEQLQKYTLGQSSSIGIDKGEEMIQSILFTADTYLKTFNKPSSSLEVLKNMSLKDIYNKGLINIHNVLSKPRKRLSELQKTMIPFQNEAYLFTINQEIPEYLKKYNVLLSAHESATFMYPLAVDTLQKSGIHGVYRYIISLSMENRICSHFAPKDIIGLLQAYNSMYKVDSNEMILNFFDIIMKNAIFASSCSDTPQNLALIKEQGEAIHKKLMSLDNEGIARFIEDAVDGLVHVLQIEEIDELEYINSYKELLLSKLLYVYKSLKKGTSEAQNQDFGSNSGSFGNYMDIILFHNEKSEAETDSIVLSQGKRLSEVAFTCVVDGVNAAQTPEEKAVIIKENIQSIYDFMDILKSACLCEDDFKVIFAGIGDIEVAAICLYTFKAEIMSGCFEFSKIHISSLEQEWEKIFAKYVKELPIDRQEALLNLIHRLKGV